MTRRKPSICASPHAPLRYRLLWTSLLCNASTKRGRLSTTHRREQWTMRHSTMLSMLLPFSGRTPERWRNSNSGLPGKPDYENLGLALASDTEAYGGHLAKARELTKRVVDSDMRADNKEAGAIYLANAALREAAYGNAAEARQSAAEALKLAPTSQGVESEAALAFAMAGDTARAESLAQDLGKRFPLDTQIQSLWLPTIQAQLALDRKNPTLALSVLQAASPIELGQIGSPTIFPAFIRVHSRSGILGSRTGQCSRRRVSEDSRPQRHRLELLDGSVGASGSGSCECFAVENLARSGCRCRPRPGARRLQRFPHPLERRRPRHPHPEASQGGVCEAAIAPSCFRSSSWV